jgi:hypothetical protein
MFRMNKYSEVIRQCRGKGNACILDNTWEKGDIDLTAK